MLPEKTINSINFKFFLFNFLTFSQVQHEQIADLWPTLKYRKIHEKNICAI